MISIKKVCLLLLSLIFLSTNSFAEIKLSNPLAKDIGKAYGYFIGQDYSLTEISKKYPHLSREVFLAKKEFISSFKPSIDGMDSLMSKYSKTEWNKIKNQLETTIYKSINIDQLTESQAVQFIAIVRQRAKGNIESPIIETLLLFKNNYQEQPEREFIDGYKYKYITNGLGKAKNVPFSIEVPKTWAAEEASRPNIVQKFVSENGRGLEIILVLIKEIPIGINERITEQDVAEFLNPDDIKDFLPKKASYLSSGELTLENLPGFWVTFKVDMSRARNQIEMETIMYVVYYKNKMIQIQGQVMTSFNGEKAENKGLKKYEKLFDLVANSFVIPELYK